MEVKDPMKLKQNISGSKKFFTFTGIPTLDFGTLEHSLLAVWTAKEYLYMKPLPQLAQKNFNSDVSGWATSKGQILYFKFSLNHLRFSQMDQKSNAGNLAKLPSAKF